MAKMSLCDKNDQVFKTEQPPNSTSNDSTIVKSEHQNNQPNQVKSERIPVVPVIKIEKKQFEVRFWNSAFQKWQEGRGPKPGPHPDPSHTWNTHPEMYDFEDD